MVIFRLLSNMYLVIFGLGDIWCAFQYIVGDTLLALINLRCTINIVGDTWCPLTLFGTEIQSKVISIPTESD